MKKRFDIKEYDECPGKWRLTDDLGRTVRLGKEYRAGDDYYLGSYKEDESDEWKCNGMFRVNHLYMEEYEGKKVVGYRSVIEGTNNLGERIMKEQIGPVVVVESYDVPGTRVELWKEMVNLVGGKLKGCGDMSVFSADKEKGIIDFVIDGKTEHWELFERGIDL